MRPKAQPLKMADVHWSITAHQATTKKIVIEARRLSAGVHCVYLRTLVESLQVPYSLHP